MSTKASSTRDKKPFVKFKCRGHSILFWTLSVLDLFPVFWDGGADQILFLEFSKDGPTENRDEFTYGDLASDTVSICTFLLLPGISVLLPVSIQFHMAS